MNKKIICLLKISISLSIIVYIFKTQVNISQVYTYFSCAKPVWLVLAGFLFSAFILLAAIRWSVLLKAQKIIVPTVRFIRIYCIGIFFNLFMVGVTGGDVVKMYYIAKQTPKGIEGGTTVFMDRIIGLSALLVGLFFGMFLIYPDQRLSFMFWPVALSFMAMLLFFCLIMNKKILKAIPFLQALIARIPFQNKIHRIYQSIYSYKKKKKQLIQVMLISLGIHFLFATMNYCVARAIGINNVGLQFYFVLIPLIGLLSALPISIGGWGIGEALYISLFALFGVPAGQAVTLSIIVKLYYSILGVCCSAAYMMPGLEKPKDLAEFEYA